MTQILRAGTSLPRPLSFVLVGFALLIPGTIPKLAGNARGLVLWFVVTNFGRQEPMSMNMIVSTLPGWLERFG